MQGRSLLLAKPRHLRWIDEELPAVGPNDLFVETLFGAVSIGTELPLYRGDSRGMAPDAYPRMTGYENLATVLACGADVHTVRVGDRVVAWYGHRTHAVISEHKAIVVPQGIRDEAALLTVLSGDVATGIRKLGEAIRAPVLVTGGGAIGLLAVFVLLALGTPAVDVVEPRPNRRDLAAALGARLVVAPTDVEALAGDYGGGVECSSRDTAFSLLQYRMRRYGKICVLADGNIEPLTLTPLFHQRELLIVGSSDCPDYDEHAHWYFPLAGTVGDVLSRIFDDHVAVADLPNVFDLLSSGAIEPVKILVRYDAA